MQDLSSDNETVLVSEPPATLTQPEPAMAPPVVAALVAGLAASRSLALDDIQRTNVLFDVLNCGLTATHSGSD